MAEASATKRSSLGKKLAITFGVILLLVVILYLVVTSAAFFKGFILPRVSKAMGADVTVADASIRPFSRVELQQLKVQPPGKEPILEAQQLVARYSLMDILGGNINVHEVSLVSPVIRVVENAEGKSNLDPVTEQEPTAEPSKTEEPAQLNIRNVTIKNGTVIALKQHADGGEERTEISDLNLSIDQLKNGANGKLELSGNAKMQSPGTNGTVNLLSGSMNGSIGFSLDQNLAPAGMNGGVQFTAGKVSGDFAELAGLKLVLNTDLSPTLVKDLSLEISRNNQRLGQIRASGPFDLGKTEGKLTVAIDSIDRNALNVLGTSQGIDFNKTQINSTNTVEISKNGQFVSVQGQFRVDSFSITQTNQTTPTVDLVSSYDLTVDQSNETALIKAFNLNGTQNKRPLLSASLSRPMQLNWGATNGAVDESAFDLTVTNLNLADWRAFAGEMNPAGTAGLRLTAVSRGAGKQLQFDVAARLQNFSAQFDTNTVQNADIALGAKGELIELKNLTLAESRFEIAQGGERAATATASGTYEVETGNADLKATLDAALPKLFQVAQIGGSKATTGKLTFNGQVKQNGKQQNVTGKFGIENFSGNYDEYQFQNFNVVSEADLQKSDQQLEIRRLLATLRQGTQEGGSIAVSGKLNTESSVGSFELTLNRLNENGLRPFLAPSLGERKLNSILLNGNATAKLNSTNSYALAGDFNLEDFVMTEPGQPAAQPLAAKMRVDVAMVDDEAQIRAFDANIKYGGQPAGQFTATGNYNPKTESGKLNLNLSGLNQNAVRVVMPKIGDKDLVTININGNVAATINSPDDAAIKAEVKVSDLVVRDPKKRQAEAPLAAQLQLDSVMTKEIIELRQLDILLSPTQRAKNQLGIRGRIDRSNTNAMSGDVAITSQSFDVTGFYDLYAGTTAQEASPGTAPQPTPASPAPPADQEPEPMKLPVGKITLTANIGEFYLREIAVTNLQVNGTVAGSRVTLSPMQMTMNGAPVKADVDVDLGVRGYGYKVSFAAQEVPLKPIVNTFMPENRDQYQGLIVANGNISTIGLTGTSLRQHLNGQMGFTFTNANIKLGPKLQPVLNVIAAAIRVPEVAQSPIDWVGTDLQFGNGKIGISRSIVKSDALRASLKGAIPIHDELTNSPLNLPLTLELRRSLASKLPKEILVTDTKPESKYIGLPNFIAIKGTVGNPKADPDFGALAKSAAAGLIRDQAPELLQGEGGRLIQGIIGGPKPAQTNASPQRPGATNQPADPVNQILDLFNRPKK